MTVVAGTHSGIYGEFDFSVSVKSLLSTVNSCKGLYLSRSLFGKPCVFLKSCFRNI